ncbi:MAG: pentapeptide repeat-containing protein [Acidobacteriota bacterium]|nr:pentapeptide repeat-containing protein [Acidobacteriota bacterium]
MYTKKQAKNFQERWSEADLQSLNRLLASRKEPGQQVDFFEDEGGRFMDLRGFEIRDHFQRLQLANVDFSFGKTVSFGQINMSTVKNCRFIYGAFDTNMGSRFEGCDFTGAKMKGAVLRGVFEDCCFKGANLADVRASQAQFVRCDFTGAGLRGVHLLSCVFDHCCWDQVKLGRGSFGRSRFIGLAADAVDFKDNIMNNTEFT